MSTINTRKLPRRAVEFTELGFGAAPIGNLGRQVSDEDAAQALSTSWAGGIRYVDTAPHYGLGLSESRLGASIGDWPRDQYVLSTKVGRILQPADDHGLDDLETGGFAVPRKFRRVWDFSADGVKRSLDSSLTRLGTDRVDVVLIHDPDEHWQEASTQAVPALVKLREEGVISAIGVGMNQSAMLTRFIRETDVDVVMLAGRYSLLDQSALADLLPAAVEREVGILAAGVFNSGLLARNRPVAAATFDYAPAPAELIARANAIADVCDEHGTTLPAAALHYVLAHPAVVTAVLGMRTAEQTQRNLDLYSTPPSPAFWDALREKHLIP